MPNGYGSGHPYASLPTYRIDLGYVVALTSALAWMRSVGVVERVAARWAARTGGGVRSVLAVDGLLALVLGGLAGEGSWSSAADRGMRLDVVGFMLVGEAAVCRRSSPTAWSGTLAPIRDQIVTAAEPAAAMAP
jgi:hypothetical protein